MRNYSEAIKSQGGKSKKNTCNITLLELKQRVDSSVDHVTIYQVKIMKTLREKNYVFTRVVFVR